jgi:hypothetical protein
MTRRRLAWTLGAVLTAAVIPAPAHADPSVPPGQPVKCVSNTQKGKQVLVPCDLLNAGANFPPGYRCPPPLEQYTQDVQDWCGVGPGLGVTPPGAPPPAPPTTPVTPTSPTSPTKPASPTSPTTPASPTKSSPPSSPTTPVTPVSPTTPVTPVSPPTPASPATPASPGTTQ